MNHARTIKRVLVVTGAATLLYLAGSALHAVVTYTHPSFGDTVKEYRDTYIE